MSDFARRLIAWHRAHGRHGRERPGPSLHVLDGQVAGVGGSAFVLDFPDGDHAIGIGIGQGPEQDGVGDAEHRAAGPDAEREREGDDAGVQRAMTKLAKREPKLV